MIDMKHKANNKKCDQMTESLHENEKARFMGKTLRFRLQKYHHDAIDVAKIHFLKASQNKKIRNETLLNSVRQIKLELVVDKQGFDVNSWKLHNILANL